MAPSCSAGVWLGSAGALQGQSLRGVGAQGMRLSVPPRLMPSTGSSRRKALGAGWHDTSFCITCSPGPGLDPCAVSHAPGAAPPLVAFEEVSAPRCASPEGLSLPLTCTRCEQLWNASVLWHTGHMYVCVCVRAPPLGLGVFSFVLSGVATAFGCCQAVGHRTPACRLAAGPKREVAGRRQQPHELRGFAPQARAKAWQHSRSHGAHTQPDAASPVVRSGVEGSVALHLVV